jgi:hypothetical protein
MFVHKYGVIVLCAAPLVGCADKQKCQQFAEHVVDVVAQEAARQVSGEEREKMVKKTGESCVAEPPSPEALDCALAAKTSEAINKCDELDAEK